MPYSALKLAVQGLLLATAAALIAARVIGYTTASAATGDVVALAWWTTAWPSAVCVAYLLTQAIIPGGRRFVPLPGSTDQDAWLLILVLASATPSITIGPPSPGGFFGTRDAVRLTTFACVAAILVRAVQLRLQLRGGRTLQGGA